MRRPSRPRPEPRDQALALLARREHSRAELELKLRRRGHAEDEVGRVLDALQAEGLLSHRRFAEAFARARVERGWGPRRIGYELRERGVETEHIEAALAPYEDEWERRARHELDRRFGPQPPGGFEERARRLRFLQRRGFPAEVARRAVGDE